MAVDPLKIPDTFHSGTVLRFSIHYPRSEKLYHFVAMKISDRWYLSGRGGTYTWAGVVNMVTGRAASVEKVEEVTGWRERAVD